MATAQGEQGIGFFLVSDRENTDCNTGNFFRHKENILNVIINIRSMLLFLNFYPCFASITLNYIIKIYMQLT